jgi:uncharacterized membrane protein YphA (DoxX/SURF4 family)
VEDLLLVTRLILAAVFIAAGISKLIAPARDGRALTAFGIPAALAPAVTIALPVVEVGVGVALVPAASAQRAAVAALLLLCTFTAAIGVSLLRGERPDCPCFGTLRPRPIGPATLARNVALAAAAALVVAEGPGASLARAGEPWVWVALAGALYAAVHGWITLELFRQNGRLLLRVDALEAAAAPARMGVVPGASAPEFRAQWLGGGEVTLDALLEPGLPVALVFVSPGCAPCAELAPELVERQQRLRGRLAVVAVTRGDAEQNEKLSGLSGVIRQVDRELIDAFGAGGTPAAVVVAADGTLAGPMARGADAIRRLLDDYAQGRPSLAITNGGPHGRARVAG